MLESAPAPRMRQRSRHDATNLPCGVPPQQVTFVNLLTLPLSANSAPNSKACTKPHCGWRGHTHSGSPSLTLQPGGKTPWRAPDPEIPGSEQSPRGLPRSSVLSPATEPRETPIDRRSASEADDHDQTPPDRRNPSPAVRCATPNRTASGPPPDRRALDGAVQWSTDSERTELAERAGHRPWQ